MAPPSGYWAMAFIVFFNDPVSCRAPVERAVKKAMTMREAAGSLIGAWRRHGCELGFGAAIAQGCATLRQIGFPNAPATPRLARYATLPPGFVLRPCADPGQQPHRCSA
ncbi:MAG: hypothetical protein JO121_22230 [Deltaproteobacteria bacterium]|nr:hypothetical protein [Deltaproteobacteria bacterium]